MNLNTKANRKKLSRALFSVHRTRYDLLPFYSRLVATLHPCMPDVAVELNTLLKTDFKWHIRKKDQINIESKLKVVRFIGELCKFNMFPKADVLHCIKVRLSIRLIVALEWNIACMSKEIVVQTIKYQNQIECPPYILGCTILLSL